MPSPTPQQLLALANCDFCKIPPGLLPYVILTAILDIQAGNPVPTDTQQLINEANCLLCYLTPGMVPYATLAALRQLSATGVGGGVQYGTANPTTAPPSGSGLFYRTDTGGVWVWNPVTLAWDPIIV